MLVSLLSGNAGIVGVLLQLLLFIPVFLIAISVHEMSHSLTAYLLGDTSQKAEGRMTLNPLKHIDPLGTLMLLIVGFGWAKPVYVNTAALKRGGRFAGAIVSAAGPVSNFILAFLFYLGQLAVIGIMNHSVAISSTEWMYAMLRDICYIGVQISIGLGVFNMIPVPPLDGFGVISPFLPRKIYYFIASHSREISMAFFMLLILYRVFPR